MMQWIADHQLAAGILALIATAAGKWFMPRLRASWVNAEIEGLAAKAHELGFGDLFLSSLPDTKLLIPGDAKPIYGRLRDLHRSERRAI